MSPYHMIRFYNHLCMPEGIGFNDRHRSAKISYNLDNLATA